MAKRTFAIVAVFAALLSVTLSVQADDYNYYWSGASDSNYLTTANWNVGAPDGPQATVGLNTSGNNITAYMYNTSGVVSLNNNTLGASVYSLNIGKAGGTGNAVLSYTDAANHVIDNGKTLSIYDGGTFTFNSSKRFVNKGTVNLNSGANFIVTAAEAIIVCGNGAELNIYDGSTLMVNNSAVPTYLGTNDGVGTINQTGGEATFNGTLALGWGSKSGHYNLSGGTLTTTGEAGLWGSNSAISDFTVSGGTANFNKADNSFEIGLRGTNALTNTFTLQGTGIVNVADTFAVKNSGILNIKGGEFNAPIITVDNTSKFNMTGGALKTNAINMNGGTFTQDGGSLVYNGKLTVTGNAVLNGAIDLSHFLASYNQTVDIVETTAGVSGNYTVTGDDWTTAIVGNKITATYTGGNNNYYWTGNRDNTYYFAANWNVNGAAYNPDPQTNPYTHQSDRYLDLLSNPHFDKNCYILTTSSDVSLDYSTLGVASLTVGNGVGGTAGTAVVSRSGNIDVQTNLIVNKGGTVSATGALTVTSRNNTPGTLTVSGGTFNANSTTEVTGNLIVSDGTYNAAGTTTINAGGNVSISGGTFNANSSTTVAGNLTVQNGTYNAKGTTTVNSGGKLTVDGGTFEFNNSEVEFKVLGDIDVLSGNLTITSSKGFRIGDYGKGTVNIEGGTVTVKSPTYMGVGASSDYVGTINQKTGSTVTFENVLALGWGNNVTGVYNLYGGTLTTTGATGLWCANPNGASMFNVTGGTANFNKAGNSFEIGLYQTYDPNQVANVFNLNSGTVNAADTFAIQYGGTLKVAKTDNNTLGDGVLNANKIEINNGGNLNLSSGTINLGAGGITNSSGAYTITLSGGTFGNNGASWATSLDATISSNAVTFAPDAGKSITWRGVMSGAGALTKTEAGTLELFGANAYTGGTTISNGQISLHANGSLGTGAIAIDANGSLTFTGDMTPQPKTIANAISGTGTIVKQGASDFTANLDGNLTGFSGNMIISGGTLSVLMNGTNTSLKVTNISGPGVLELRLASGNGNTTLPNLTNNGFTGVISLVESGGSNGNKIDTGSKSFEGFTFNINSGTTIYVDEAAFGANVNLSGTGNNEGHGALRLHNNMAGNITVMANNSVLGIDRTAVTVSGNIASGANSGVTTLVIKNVVNDNGKGTFTGNIADNIVDETTISTLGIKIASGTHTFASGEGKSLTYTGATTVDPGATLKLSGANANLLNSSSAIVNGTLDVTGYTGTTTMQVNKLTGSGIVNIASNALTLNNNAEADSIFSGAINGTGAVNKTGTGTLTLSGANTYTGLTTVSAGVLELTGDAIVANGQVYVDTNGTLKYSWNGSGDKTLTIDAVAKKIYGTGKVIVNADEEAVLKIYTSAKGMIDVQSLTISSGRVDIKDYFDGQLIVQGQGTFSPGNSVGTLIIGDGTYGDGGFILNEAGAELLMEIAGSAPSANDGLIVAGPITLADDSVITLVNNSNLGLGESFTAILSAENSSSLKVLEHIQTTDFTDLKYVQINDATHGTVYAITGRTLNANEVPEPSTWALLALGVCGLLYLRKRS